LTPKTANSSTALASYHLKQIPLPAVFARLPEHGHIATALTFYGTNIVKIRCNTSTLIKCRYKSWGTVWSVTLSEEHRMRAFKKRVPRKIFGAKRDDVTGD